MYAIGGAMFEGFAVVFIGGLMCLLVSIIVTLAIIGLVEGVAWLLVRW